MKISMIGLDLAKSVFQVHGIDAERQVVVQRKLGRNQMIKFFARLKEPCVVGMEACGTSHYWGRRLLELGHQVRLMPARYVKPFVRRNKTDARDAEAICTALQHPDMRFVPVKSAERQADRAVERSRELLVKQHTQLCNSVRSLLAEHGVIAAQGRKGFAMLVATVRAEDPDGPKLPDTLVVALQAMLEQIDHLAPAIAELDKRIVETVRATPAMRLLTTITGVGPILAHAIVAAAGDGRQFRSARDFAAWVGLTPQEHSSAGKRRERGISRQGDCRLRKLFALGASTIMRNARANSDRATDWQRAILARRPMKVAVLAQAAKTARIAWAVLTSGQPYQPHRLHPVPA